MNRVFCLMMFLVLAFAPFISRGEEVLLTWDQNQEAELAGYNVYYGNSSGVYFEDPFTLPQESLVAVDGTVTYQFPTTLSPELTHYFSITAYDIWGYETGFSNEVRYPLPEGSTDTSVIINNNDLVTYSPNVILTLFAAVDGQELDGNAQRTFSNDNQVWSDPEPYARTKEWRLSLGEGTKTVYAKFGDGAGNWITDTVQDQIIYEVSGNSCDDPQMLSPVSITASSVSPFSAIEYVLDGNPVTAWSTFSFFQKEEFITLDLGELKRVSSFDMFAAKLYGLDFFPPNFQIQTSRDNINWLTISSEQGYTASFEPPYSDRWNFDNLSCRYIRIYITKAKTLLFLLHIAQIAEIEVSGCDLTADVPVVGGKSFLNEAEKVPTREKIATDQETGQLPLTTPGKPVVKFK